MTHVALGLILILIGLVFLLGIFAGHDPWDYVKTYWPTIFIFTGLFNLFDRKSSKLSSFILISFGIALQIDRLDLLDINVWKLFWPILLIILGVRILMVNKSKSYTYSKELNKDNKENHFNKEEELDYDNISKEDYISKSTILFGSTVRNSSKNFKGGNISVVLGGTDLDLRQAEIKGKNITLNVDVILGGLDIFVPENWNVHLKTTHILGSSHNHTKFNDNPDAPVLTIAGSIVLGSVNVK